MPIKIYSKTFGAGEDIVMLHGWAMHSGIWLDLAHQLAQSYRITLIDLPGYGDGDLSCENYELENIAQQILAVTPAKAIWVGWSMGGLIAMWIAIHQPQTVKKIILVNSSPCFIEKPNWPGMQLEVFNEFKKLLKKDLYRTILRFLGLQLNAKPSDLRQLKTILLTKKLPTIATLISGLDLLRTNDLCSQLSNIKCPALFILGAADRLVPAAIGSFLNIMSTAQIEVIPSAAHIPFFSHPQLFLEIVMRFLYAK